MDPTGGIPSACPYCQSPRIGPIQDPDITALPGTPTAPTPYPGVLTCRDCGAIIQWEP